MPLSKRIIPCLDVDKGRVVKGVKFLRLRDAGDPVEIARSYDEQGADELVFLDINASVENRETMADVVRRVASEIFIPLTVGGGIRNSGDIARMLRAGADKVAINSAAIINPDLVAEAAERFGTQCIVIAIDAKRKKDKTSWEVMSHGGRKHTGKDVLQWAQAMAEAGAGEILLTSVDCDGGKTGYDIELTRTISDAVNIPVIASGGVGKLEHLHEGLIKGRADAVLAASIFHFGQHSIGEAKQYLFQHGVNVRL